MLEITTWISDTLWSTPMIVLVLGLGVWFSIRMLLPQFRRIADMVRYLVGGDESTQGLSSFESFAMALGGRVGVGNIAGVATAIHFGGPGAVFWMWVTAFVGAAVAIAESSLAQVWKEEINGEYRGGPAYYIEKGIGWKWLAVLYAIGTVFATVITGPTIQSFNIATSAETAFSIPAWVMGVLVAGLFCLVVFGGMHRLGRTVGLIVPFMAAAYIILGIVVLVLNADAVPEMFGLIFRSAFGGEAMFGGMLGAVVLWGVRRAIYSSEVGTGSAAQSAAAAEVSHPVKQGLAQGFSAYVDTLFVCTITALMILSSGTYNVVGPDGETVVEHAPGLEAGPDFTQAAIDAVLPGWGAGFIAVAMFFFAFTTLLSFGFYAETNIDYLMRGGRSQRIAVTVARIGLAGSILLGALRSSDFAWSLADVGLGFYTWVNLVALVILAPKAIAVVRDYDRQRREGKDPVFDPEAVGIHNAPVWKEIARRREERASGVGGGAAGGGDQGHRRRRSAQRSADTVRD